MAHVVNPYLDTCTYIVNISDIREVTKPCVDNEIHGIQELVDILYSLRDYEETNFLLSFLSDIRWRQ